MRKFGYAMAASVAMAGSAGAAAPEAIGSWVLTCADSACVLRHRDRLFNAAGLSADVEIEAEGKALVPVVALRGLPNEVLLASSMAGKAEASVQFPGVARADMECTAGDGGFHCAPRDESVAALAAALPAARSMTVRVSLSVAGSNSLPARERTLDLGRTPEALARLRAAGAPSAEPSGWISLLDRGLKAAGYKNGTADLPGLLAGFLKR